uniref:Uncharacterized protein n=1 Tax=Arundo donax TaxID=35708 RepID=A0A0A9AVU1_ARUDO
MFPHVSGIVVKGTVKRREREMTVEKPNVVPKVFGIIVCTRPEPHELRRCFCVR